MVQTVLGVEDDAGWLDTFSATSTHFGLEGLASFIS